MQKNKQIKTYSGKQNKKHSNETKGNEMKINKNKHQKDKKQTDNHDDHDDPESSLLRLALRPTQ